MRKKVPKEVECKQSGALINEVLPYVFSYARRKRFIDKPFQEYYDLEDEWEEYPDGWEEQVLGMLAATAVLGTRKRAGAFARSVKSELTDNEFSLVKLWRTRPWGYCVFTVSAEYEGNIVEIEPLGDPPKEWPEESISSTLLLYSPAVSNQYRHGKNVFIALLWEGEHTFQIYGVPLAFSGITADDIFFFADIARTHRRSPLDEPLKGINARTTGLSDIVMKHQLAFLRLFTITEAPLMQSREGPLLSCASVITVPDISSVWEEERWRKAAEANGENVYWSLFEDYAAAVYFGEGSPMYDPVVYLSYKDSRVFLVAMTEKAYDRGRTASTPLCDFPERPLRRASMAIESKATEIFSYEDELLQLREYYNDLLEEQGGPVLVGAEDAEVERANAPADSKEAQAILDRLTGNFNEGIEEDDARIAASLGVEENVVAYMREKIESMFDRTEGGGVDRDNAPADRFGLSPRAFSQLSHKGVPDAKGIFRLRDPREILAALSEGCMYENGEVDPVEVLSSSTAFSLSRWLLAKAVRDGFIPATQAGYVGTKVIKEVVEKRIIPTVAEKVERVTGLRSEAESLVPPPQKESDWPEFILFRRLLEHASLIVYNGKQFLPGKDAEDFLENPAGLYHRLLTRMFTDYEWDYAPRFGTVPHLRDMAGFLFYAIGKLSDEAVKGAGKRGKGKDRAQRQGWFEGELLEERFIKAVPTIAETIEEQEQSDTGTERFDLRTYITIMLRTVFLEDFAEPFGLAEISPDTVGPLRIEIKPGPLYSFVFER